MLLVVLNDVNTIRGGGFSLVQSSILKDQFFLFCFVCLFSAVMSWLPGVTNALPPAELPCPLPSTFNFSTAETNGPQSHILKAQNLHHKQDGGAVQHLHDLLNATSPCFRLSSRFSAPCQNMFLTEWAKFGAGERAREMQLVAPIGECTLGWVVWAVEASWQFHRVTFSWPPSKSKQRKRRWSANGNCAREGALAKRLPVWRFSWAPPSHTSFNAPQHSKCKSFPR